MCLIIMHLIQAQYERTVKDNDILNQRLTKAQQDYENQLMQSDQLAGENSQKNAELKLKEEEVISSEGRDCPDQQTTRRHSKEA